MKNVLTPDMLDNVSSKLSIHSTYMASNVSEFIHSDMSVLIDDGISSDGIVIVDYRYILDRLSIIDTQYEFTNVMDTYDISNSGLCTLIQDKSIVPVQYTWDVHKFKYFGNMIEFAEG